MFRLFRRIFPQKQKNEIPREVERVERFTKCDLCENLEVCICEGRLLEVTREEDTMRHFIRGIGCFCHK